MLLLDKHLIVWTERRLRVIDVRTGASLVDLPHEKRSPRKSLMPGDVELKAVLAGSLLILGTDTSIYGLDLTPTAAVPKGQQELDPANASKQVTQWVAAVRATEGNAYSKISFATSTSLRSLSDTPDAVPELRETINRLLSGQGWCDDRLLRALSWLDSPAIPKAIVRCVRERRLSTRYQGFLVAVLAAHPKAAPRSTSLREIANDATRPKEIRDLAKGYLRLEDISVDQSGQTR